MKRYLISLLILTLVLAVVALALGAFAPGSFNVAYLILVAYFALVTGVQHMFVTRSTKADPRTFVRNFFMVTLLVLALHMIVMVVYVFSHLKDAMANKTFAIAFLTGYFAYLVFETVALVMYVHRQQKEAKQAEHELESQE